MTPEQLYEAGRLDDAIAALAGRLRESPMDARSRTFLFELLCFAGEFGRAEKHLDILADAGPEAQIGAMVYRTALHASRERLEMFDTRSFPILGEPPVSPAGTLNGTPFTTLEDADPRIGARLEVFAAGQYMWIPLKHVARLETEGPKRLRDLLWMPAHITTGPELRDLDLGEVLLPVVTPLAFRHDDPKVRLGRSADVVSATGGDEGEAWPEGAKVLLLDDDPLPLVDLRELVITSA